jgi:TusA-related sulfurtransferase
MPRAVVVLLDNPDGRSMIKEACKENGVHFSEFEELVQAEVEQTGKQRKRRSLGFL